MNNLAKYRGIHQITQTELGNKIGCTKAGISFMEKGKISPKAAELCAEALNENVFLILGADAFRVLPKTDEDKKVLIDIIKGL